MKKTVLITGAAGFAGHHLANYFMNEGKDDYKTALAYHHANKIHPDTDIAYIGDLSNPDFADSVIANVRPDVIVHCAGAVPQKGKETTDEAFMRANVDTLDNLTKACYRANCNAHIILPSTAAVYPIENFSQAEDFHATVQDLMRNETIVHKFAENEIKPMEEMNPYGQSKYLAEEILTTYDGPWTILRKPTVVGTDDTRGNFAYEAIYHALSETDFTTSKKFSADNLGHVREYLTTHDMYRAIDTAIKNPQSRGEIFNIGSNQALSGYQVVNYVADLSAEFLRESVFICVPDADELTLNSSVVLDCSKAQEVLGFTALDKDADLFREVTQSSVNPATKDLGINIFKNMLAIK